MRRLTVIFLIIFVVITAYSLSAAKDYTVFDIVGDSISAGVNPDYSGDYGWVQMLFGLGTTGSPPKSNTIYTLWSNITVYNSARSGSTAIQWSADYSSWLTGVKNHHPELVVVYIGGNDFLAYSAAGPITDTEFNIYRNNLRTIIDALHNNTPNPDIILVNYYDLFDGYSRNLPSAFSTYTSLSDIVIRGNQVIEEVAIEKGCSLVTVYPNFMHHCYGVDLIPGDTQHLSPDFVKRPLLSNFDIHPNTNGHNQIYNNVYAQLVTLKNATTSVDHWMLYH
ncbi:MAG: SGNH/GDSL hydrolase family protein [bacterium]